MFLSTPPTRSTGKRPLSQIDRDKRNKMRRSQQRADEVPQFGQLRLMEHDSGPSLLYIEQSGVSADVVKIGKYKSRRAEREFINNRGIVTALRGMEQPAIALSNGSIVVAVSGLPPKVQWDVRQKFFRDFDAGTVGSQKVYVTRMPYAINRTLRNSSGAKINSDVPLLFMQLAVHLMQGLHVLHTTEIMMSPGMMHNDIRPENVFLFLHSPASGPLKSCVEIDTQPTHSVCFQLAPTSAMFQRYGLPKLADFDLSSANVGRSGDSIYMKKKFPSGTPMFRSPNAIMQFMSQLEKPSHRDIDLTVFGRDDIYALALTTALAAIGPHSISRLYAIKRDFSKKVEQMLKGDIDAADAGRRVQMTRAMEFLVELVIDKAFFHDRIDLDPYFLRSLEVFHRFFPGRHNVLGVFLDREPPNDQIVLMRQKLHEDIGWDARRAGPGVPDYKIAAMPSLLRLHGCPPMMADMFRAMVGERDVYTNVFFNGTMPTTKAFFEFFAKTISPNNTNMEMRRQLTDRKWGIEWSVSGLGQAAVQDAEGPNEWCSVGEGATSRLLKLYMQ